MYLIDIKPKFKRKVKKVKDKQKRKNIWNKIKDIAVRLENNPIIIKIYILLYKSTKESILMVVL